MQARFHRPDEPDEEVGSVTWTGSRVEYGDAAEETLAALRRIFRPAPVVIDDASLRSFGTSGPAVLEPGDLRWFLAAAQTRSGSEGLAARLLPDGDEAMGWDPAGAYRTFGASVERRDRLGAEDRPGSPT
jgi:hypothetical protein